MSKSDKNYYADYNFEAKNPIGLIPWNIDFLDELENLIQGLAQKKAEQDSTEFDYTSNKQNIILIFPHNRPRRYLENRYKKLAKKLKKSLILPTILTENQFIKICLSHFERGQNPYQELQILDRVDLLYQSVLEVAKNLPKSAVLKRLIELDEEVKSENLFDHKILDSQSLSLAKFFPYAFSLDRIFEECFNQCVEVVDISHAEGEVEDLAAALLATLKSIKQAYLTALLNPESTNNSVENNGKIQRFSSPAFANFRVAKFIEAYEKYNLNKNFQDENNNYLLGIENFDQKQAKEYFDNFMPPVFRDKIIIFAGFVRLTATQEKLFNYFWNQGACFVWHSDAALAKQKSNPHYSCADHSKWLNKWKTSCSLLKSSKQTEPILHFLAGYDNHSQIKVFMQDLDSCIQSLNSKPSNDLADFNAKLADDALAILLPKPSLLMPVLHDLPEKEINISMGYPVTRTLLTQFLDIVFNLQIQKSNLREERQTQIQNYYWYSILSLLRHPYTKMLAISEAEDLQNLQEVNEKWRNLLFFLENKLKCGNAFFNLQDFLDSTLGDYDNHHFSEEVLNFCEDFIAHHIINFEKIDNLFSLGQALEKLTAFLLKYAHKLWENFPLDGEALVRLVENVIPTLKENRFAHKHLPKSALFSIFKQLFDSERIPFEADPLSGMQILGMLESRLLRFKKVFILDLTEENLPGKTKQDPLLPDSLRELLSLPSSQSGEILMAHTMYRLLVGAEEVWLYWQEGILASNLQEKNTRSRFVEELIWNKEKNIGKLLSSEDIIRSPKIHNINFSRQNKKDIIRTDQIETSLIKFLQYPLSPTAIDTYINCPAKFFYSYLANLKEETSVNEDDDIAKFGSWFHNFLKEVYSEYLNKKYSHNEDNLKFVLEKFEKEIPYDKIQHFISPENYFILKQSGKHHLSRYFYEMKDEIVTPLALEQEFRGKIDIESIKENKLGIQEINLKGIFDRVDQREINGTNYHLVLDYKTGKKQNLNQKLWDDLDFWHEIEQASQNRNFQNQDLFKLISKKFPSIQLPLYLYIYNQNFQEKSNAAWVFLREKNKETPLITLKDNDFNALNNIKNKLFPKLLNFCINHLLNSSKFEALANKSCEYCPHKNYC